MIIIPGILPAACWWALLVTRLIHGVLAAIRQANWLGYKMRRITERQIDRDYSIISMFKRQRAAKWFLCLACLVILVCMTQRIASLHALEKNLLLTSSSQMVADANDSPTPCELSAKSLLASPPVLFELAIFSLGLLLLLLVPVIPTRMRFPPPRAISPSGLRVHLRLCIFRE